MLSCCGARKPPEGETQPLLPHQHDDDTALQRQLHDKRHGYEMIRALSTGYMPSTDQAIAHLRALLVSDFLNPDNPTLSASGRRLAKDCKILVRILGNILREKNGADELQEIIWRLSNSKASVDTAGLASRASASKAHADTAAAYESFRTVGNLLLTNADFRRLVKDVTTVGRSIFSDTASSVSATAGELSNQVEPSQSQKQSVTASSSSSDETKAPTNDQLRQEAQEVVDTTGKEAKKVGHNALKSTEENVSGEVKESLLHRVKQTIDGLRQRDDYSSSVSTISGLVKRVGVIYTQAAESTISDAEEEIEVDPELNLGVKNIWTFLGSFGDQREWQKLEHKFKRLMQQSKTNEGPTDLVNHIADSIHKMFMDPTFFDSSEDTLENLKQKYREIETNIPSQDVDEFFQQLKRAFMSLSRDPSIKKLVAVSRKISDDVSTAYHNERSRLGEDALHIFFPLLVRAIQHIPIPRLEISVPEMDLLLENVVLEPGHTFHNSSFLPYRVLLSTMNNLEIRKTHSKETNSAMKNVVTASVNGLNVSAKEFGYWVRVHSPPFLPFFKDEGIASFSLDQRGIDISIDFEVGRQRLEQILCLRAVRVHIYKLDYTVRKSNWTFMWWLLKPFLKHMIRRILEKTIAEKIVAIAHVVNRELVFARERLRATRVADPDDFATFVRAVMSRLSGKIDPDIYTRIGIDAHRKGIFDGVYTPGSIVQKLQEERRRAEDNIEAGDQSDIGERSTWRNEIFNVLPTSRAERYSV